MLELWFFLFLFFFKRRREWAGGGPERERERENLRQTPCLAWNLTQAYLRTLRSWSEQESRVSCLTNWATEVPLVVLEFLVPLAHHFVWPFLSRPLPRSAFLFLYFVLFFSELRCFPGAQEECRGCHKDGHATSVEWWGAGGVRHLAMCGTASSHKVVLALILLRFWKCLCRLGFLNLGTLDIWGW